MLCFISHLSLCLLHICLLVLCMYGNVYIFMHIITESLSSIAAVNAI